MGNGSVVCLWVMVLWYGSVGNGSVCKGVCECVCDIIAEVQ